MHVWLHASCLHIHSCMHASMHTYLHWYMIYDILRNINAYLPTAVLKYVWIYIYLLARYAFLFIYWHPEFQYTPRLPDWRSFHGSNAKSRSSVFFQYFIYIAWNQHDSLFGPPSTAQAEGDDEDEHVCMCSGIRYMLSWLKSRVFFGADCKQSLSISSTVSMQEEAEAKRRKAEARCHDTWHVKGGCWKMKERSENKELWLIYLQVLLGARISKQYLLLHVGKLVHACGMLLRVFVGLTSEMMLMYVDVIWKYCSNGRNGRKTRNMARRIALNCNGIGTCCTRI